MATKAGLWEPTSEQAAYLLGFSRNGEHFIKNLDQMKKKFAGKFVAVLDNDVIQSSDEASDLLTFLRNKYPESISEIYVTYVPTETEVRIA